MVKIQFELTKKADMIISLFKVKKGLKTKGEAINRILEQREE
jgi:hypothetical protein